MPVITLRKIKITSALNKAFFRIAKQIPSNRYMIASFQNIIDKTSPGLIKNKLNRADNRIRCTRSLTSKAVLDLFQE